MFFQPRRGVQEEPGFDQNIVSLLEMQGMPFTGCGRPVSPWQAQGHLEKDPRYHRIHVPNFVVIPRGQRIARPRQLKFPILVKPVKEEASCGIAQASFVRNRRAVPVSAWPLFTRNTTPT
jgi:D-alanine-D-alanine ligase